MAFPSGKHDDKVDSVTQYIMWLYERVAGGGFSYSFLNEPVDAGSIAYHVMNIRQNF